MILSKEEVERKRTSGTDIYPEWGKLLLDSHEELRAQRDKAVELLRQAARGWAVAPHETIRDFLASLDDEKLAI